MRLNIAFALLLAAAVCSCSDPKSTEIPTSMEKMESIKPQLEKLTGDERELFAGYAVRHTLGAAMGGMFGIKAEPIPAGMTIGKAIDEQRKFKADAAAEEAKQAALKVKLQSEREAAMKPMREAVTVTLVSKKIEAERGYSGMVTDEKLEVVFGYKNNTEKDIAGVKGRITMLDLFGDQISGFIISNDNTILAGKTSTWSGSRSVKYSLGSNKDRKLAELEDDKYKLVWEPQIIVFKDGTKLSVPAE
jgi:hypothetical protein